MTKMSPAPKRPPPNEEIDERITGGCDRKYEMHNECGSIV